MKSRRSTPSGDSFEHSGQKGVWSAVMTGSPGCGECNSLFNPDPGCWFRPWCPLPAPGERSLMSPTWTAEHVVSAELARDLIERQLPELTPVRLHPFGVGWDNTSYLANETWVFRFPRRT